MSLKKQLFNFANTRDCVVSTPAKLKPLSRILLLTCQKSLIKKKKIDSLSLILEIKELNRKYCQKRRVWFSQLKTSEAQKKLEQMHGGFSAFQNERGCGPWILPRTKQILHAVSYWILLSEIENSIPFDKMSKEIKNRNTWHLDISSRAAISKLIS